MDDGYWKRIRLPNSAFGCFAMYDTEGITRNACNLLILANSDDIPYDSKTKTIPNRCCFASDRIYIPSGTRAHHSHEFET